jgi:thiol-disulfide isomerase/thioredoxin
MRRILGTALVLAVGCPTLWADDTKSESKPTPQQQLKSLQSAFVKERTAIMKDVLAAEEKDRPKIYATKMVELTKAYAPKFMELGKANLGDDVGFMALLFALQNGGAQYSGEAFDLILDKYEKKLIANPMILERAGAKGERALRDLLTKNTEGDAHVRLTHSLGNMLFSQAEMTAGAPDAEAKLKEAEKLFDEVAAIAKEGTREFDSAKGFLHEIRDLQVGKIIPDLESHDLEGNTVKLSDFRGKVLVLDVWATWCGPCREMIPHERELAEKLKGKPFVLLSVSCDDKKETLTDFLDHKEKMPWTHWWDGRGGPITKGLNLRYYPTIYVLDAKGTIRFKGVRGEMMDEAVEKLLKELETSN